MDGLSGATDIAINIVNDCMVVPIQADLHDAMIRGLQARILERIQATGIRGVVIDLSTVRVLDSFAFQSLVDTAKMASLLGAKTVLVGLQPGVVSSLIDLDLDFKACRTAITVEDAFEQIRPPAADQKPIEESGTDDENAEEDPEAGDEEQEAS